jgi:hypothetical protein
MDLDLKRVQGPPGGARLVAAAVGQLAVEVGLEVVRDGLAVPQEPELLGHTARQGSDAAQAAGYRV